MRRILVLVIGLAMLAAAIPASGTSFMCAGRPVTIIGTRGPDVLIGTANSDVIHGRGGGDIIKVKAGNDIVCGGLGNDTIIGGTGDDLLKGGDGNDRLEGRGGADRLNGGRGADQLIGGRHNDILQGGGGNDLLDGGPGQDRLFGSWGLDTCSGETQISCEATLEGRAYYVSPTGDDTSDGLTEATAFRTIAHALQTVQPGEQVRILPGRYRQRTLVEGVGGASGTVTVTGWRGRPVIDGGGTRTLGIFCELCRNVVFQNLEVTGFTDIGIGGTLGNGLTFRNLLVHGNGAAVKLIGWELEGYGIHVDDSSNILIEANDVYGNGPNPAVFPDRLLGTGINTFGLTHATIRNNLSHANHGGGILVEDSIDVLVEGNEVYDNDLDAWDADEWWDGGLWLDGGRDVVVRDNYFHDNLGPGIEISDEDHQSPTGYVLEGNVSTGNYYGVFVWGFGTTGWPGPGVIARSDNDFSGNTRKDVWIEKQG